MDDLGVYSQQTHLPFPNCFQVDPENNLYYSFKRIFLINRAIVSQIHVIDLENQPVDKPGYNIKFFYSRKQRTINLNSEYLLMIKTIKP